MLAPQHSAVIWVYAYISVGQAALLGGRRRGNRLSLPQHLNESFIFGMRAECQALFRYQGY